MRKSGIPAWGCRSVSERSAGLAVLGVRPAARAELLQLHPVRVVPAVLLGDVVAFLAVHARQGDLGADVGALAGHGVPSSCLRKSWCYWRSAGSGGGARSRDLTIMSRAL